MRVVAPSRRNHGQAQVDRPRNHATWADVCGLLPGSCARRLSVAISLPYALKPMA